ncbi:hypothetical protein LA080_006214 [Diaporthe eres]|nr:hypothetical protein LA080_006214 [Diaporthe eres]
MPENEGGKTTPEKQHRDICRRGEGFEPTGSKPAQGTGRGLKIRGAIGVASFWQPSAVMLTFENPFSAQHLHF